MRPTFVRFVVHKKHWQSGERTGLFQAINDAFEGDDAPNHLRPAIREIADWFNANLSSPFRTVDQINRSHVWWRRHQAQTRPNRMIQPQPRSLSWIKESAAEHVNKLYHLKSLMEEIGWLVEILRTTRPGEILYEDEYQVVAILYSDTPT